MSVQERSEAYDWGYKTAKTEMRLQQETLIKRFKEYVQYTKKEMLYLERAIGEIEVELRSK